MKKKIPEIDFVGLIIILFGLLIYPQVKGFGLLIVTIGFLKLFWEIIKND